MANIGFSMAARLESQLSDLLQQVHPATILGSASRGAATGLDLLDIGNDRFLWTLLAGACGQDESPELIAQYSAKAFDWLQVWMAANRCSIPEPGIPVVVHSLPTAEALRRILPTDTRFPWITKIVIDAAAAAVKEKSGIDVIGPKAAGQLIREVRRTAPKAGVTVDPRGYVFEGEAQALLENIACDTSAFAARGFRRLMTDREAEIWPAVRTESGTFPIAIRTIAGSIEVALFEFFARRGHDKGKLFERTVQLVLQEISLKGATVYNHDSYMRPSSGQNPMETDLVVDLGSNVGTIIGEVKCYQPSRNSDASALGKPIADAANQASLRASYFAGHVSIVEHGGSLLSASGRPPATPVVITSQSGGQSVWSAAALSAIGAPDAVILPIHHLALVVSLARDTADLSKYLAFRKSALNHGIQALDEHELLLMYLNSGVERLEQLTKMGLSHSRGSVALTSHVIPFRPAFLKERPRQAEAWRRWFYAKSVPAEVPVPGIHLRL